jgi:hypothetical protein
LPQRGNAYQPRVQPWDPDSRETVRSEGTSDSQISHSDNAVMINALTRFLNNRDFCHTPF